MDVDEKYMRVALKLAEKARENGDVPIGCVIVSAGKVIARAYNKRNKLHNALAHGEILAIRAACRRFGDWRLDNLTAPDITMYITLEPCPMCAGAILQARIPEVVIGAMSPKSGCAGSVINILNMKGFNHKANVRYGVLAGECAAMMTEFFDGVRGNI